MRSFLLLFALTVATAAACSSASSTDSPSTTPDGGSTSGDGSTPVTGALPCDVQKVITDHCLLCHADPPEFGAPMGLGTFADFHVPAKTDATKSVYELVPTRIANDASPMPPSPKPRLSDAERAVLTSWAAAGAPAGTGATCDGADAGTDVDASVGCTPDLSIAPASAYAMPSAAEDEYVCYGVELARPSPTHVTAFVPRIDNTKIVHHVVLFEADEAYSSTPTACDPGGSLAWRMVLGWAPGNKGLVLPPEAGFPLATQGQGTTHYVVQMHYSNPQGLSGQTDQSGFDLCTSAPRQFEADTLAFGTQNIDMSPGQSYSRVCSVQVADPFTGLHVIAAMPHMHKLGTAIGTNLQRGATTMDLGTIPSFSFANQPYLEIGGNVVTQKDDVITTRCDWKNTTPEEVTFGQTTAQEMCYSFTVYYPKVQASGVSWVTPAALSQCQ